MIKWIGRSTHGTKWEVIADDMLDLWNKLQYKNIIGDYDCDNWNELKLESNGIDSDEFYERLGELHDLLPDTSNKLDYDILEEYLLDNMAEPNDDDIYNAIIKDNSNAFYQEFLYLYECSYRCHGIRLTSEIYTTDKEEAKERYIEELKLDYDLDDDEINENNIKIELC